MSPRIDTHTCLSQVEFFTQHLVGKVGIGLEAEADFVAGLDVFKFFNLNLLNESIIESINQALNQSIKLNNHNQICQAEAHRVLH